MRDQISPEAESDEDVLRSSSPVPAVTGGAGNVVEDRPESLGRRKLAPERLVSGNECPQLLSGQTRERTIENVARIGSLRVEQVATGWAQKREKGEEKRPRTAARRLGFSGGTRVDGSDHLGRLLRSRIDFVCAN
jgi:hypothetical protein